MAINPIRAATNYGAIGNDPEIGFSENNMEIKNICENVTTNIYTINSCVKNLKSMLPLIGTVRDNTGLREQVHVSQLSGNEVVQATHISFKRLTILSRTANKQQKLQIEKLTNHFKDAVNAYSQIQKQIAEKLRTNLLKTEMDVASPSENDTALLLEEEERVQKLRQEQKNVEFEQGLWLEREKRMNQIEADILDVNQIMRELGALVHEQAPLVDSIENNVERVNNDVQEASRQLLQAENYQRKIRNKKLYLFLILSVILIVLIVIIVYSLR